MLYSIDVKVLFANRPVSGLIRYLHSANEYILSALSYYLQAIGLFETQDSLDGFLPLHRNIASFDSFSRNKSGESTTRK